MLSIKATILAADRDWKKIKARKPKDSVDSLKKRFAIHIGLVKQFNE